MDYGIKLDAVPAERVRELAPLIDQSGLDELWVVEDLGLAGGIAQAATLLADTSRVRVGIGITPAVARNPAYLAMEIATLSRMHPGRFMPGIGHGMPNWLEQVGARPKSLLTALEEVATAVKQLLSGQSVSLHGRHVHLDQVTLTHPPFRPPPISLGVRGPKGVALSSSVSVIMHPPTIRRCLRLRLRETRPPAPSRSSSSKKQVSTPLSSRHCPVKRGTSWMPSVTSCSRRVRDDTRGSVRVRSVEEGQRCDHPAARQPVGGRVSFEGDFAPLADRYLALGTPDQVAARIAEFATAGASTVLIQPAAEPGDRQRVVRTIREDVLPRVRRLVTPL